MAKRRSDNGFEVAGRSESGEAYTVIVHSAPFGCISYRAVSKKTGELLCQGITDMPRTQAERADLLKQVRDEVGFALLQDAFDYDAIPF